MRLGNSYPVIGAPAILAAVCLLAAGAAHGADDDGQETLADSQQIILQEAPTSIRIGDDNVVRRGSFEGSFELPDTETSIRIGGYAKADLIVDLDDPGAEDWFITSTIPAQPRDDNPSSRIHARQSRINVEARQPTALGEMQIFIEGDFFGGGGNQLISNSHELRLRHAFGQVGPILAGQTWSNYIDVAALPETLDFEGPPGTTTTRQPQIRYSRALGDGWTFAAAAENPEGDVLDDSTSTTLDGFVDLTLRTRWYGDFGHLHLSTVLRDLAADRQAADPAITEPETDHAFGWGANFSGVVYLDTRRRDHLSFQVNFGEGIGRYIQDFAGFGADATLEPGGGKDLDPRSAIGAHVSAQHWWTERWRSNLVLGYAGLENFDRGELNAPAPGSLEAFDNSQYLAANLIWSPVSQLNVGAEFLAGRREFFDDGTIGDDDRIAKRVQTSVQFLF